MSKKLPPPPPAPAGADIILAGVTFRRQPDGEFRAPGLRMHYRYPNTWILWSSLGATFGESPALALAKHRTRLERAQKALGYR